MRKPGRPPVDENDSSVRVGVTLPAKQFDRLAQEAIRQGTSVPEVVRRLLYGNAYTELKSKK